MDHIQRIGIADLGTNTFTFIIAEKLPQGGFSIIEEFTRSSALGRYGLKEKRIPEQAMHEGLDLLRFYAQVADSCQADSCFALATSAFRTAENGQEFAALIERETRFQVQILSGAREAELILKGVRAADILHSPSLMLDIGGGSCEFSVADAHHVYYQKSFEIGMVRARETCQSWEEGSADWEIRLRAFFEEPLQEVMAAAYENNAKQWIGTAGTFDSLAVLQAESKGERWDKLYQECRISPSDFERIKQRILSATPEERMQIPNIPLVRVAFLPYALFLVELIFEKMPSDSPLLCTSYSMREGLAYEIFAS